MIYEGPITRYILKRKKICVRILFVCCSEHWPGACGRNESRELLQPEASAVGRGSCGDLNCRNQGRVPLDNHHAVSGLAALSAGSRTSSRRLPGEEYPGSHCLCSLEDDHFLFSRRAQNKISQHPSKAQQF